MSLPPVLVRLFDAENRHDWSDLAALLHPDVEWTVVPSRRGRSVGIAAYLERLEGAYSESGGTTLKVRHVIRGGDDLTATELVDQDGGVSLEVFQLEDGRVRRTWEYLFHAPVQEISAGDELPAAPE